jgi:ribonuclease D
VPNTDPSRWPKAKLIETPDALHGCIKEWENMEVLGLDSESNSFFAYRDRLCLLQVTANGVDYLVDPLTLGDELKALNPLLADPKVVKIFHAAEYDLMLLRQDLGADVRGLFDTQVAMTLLSYQRTGLAHLLEESYGLQVSKKEQRSNWGQRPLTQSQQDYARTDTHYLPDLYLRLQAELIDKDMMVVAKGEFQRLEIEVLEPRKMNLEGWTKMKQARRLDGAAKARLRELFQWREKTAERIDKPTFRVLANETLIELAAQPPEDMRSLAARRGMGWPKAKRVGEEVLKALGRAEGKVVENPAVTKVDPVERRRRRLRRENYESLRGWRKNTAEDLGLPSERLIHRRHLEEIAKRLPRTREDLLRTVSLNDWQRQNLEESLLELLAALPDPNQS